MRQLSNRSHVNVNNAAQYSRLDREMDRSLAGHTAGHARKAAPSPTTVGPRDISSVIRHQPRPLRLAATPDAPRAEVRMSVRVHGESCLGLAMSPASLIALIEKGYLEADAVRIVGRIGGRSVSQVNPEEGYEDFRMASGF